MVELLFSYAALALFAAGLFVLSREVGTRFPGGCTIYCALLLVLGFLLCWEAGGDLRWGLWVPTSIAFQMSYSPSLLIVCSAGFLSVNQTVRARRRGLLSSGLCIAVVALFASALARPHWRPPQLSPQTLWAKGVCLQSHESSCVPAAVANLLHLHGFEFSERDLASIALTSLDGSPPVGSFLAISRAVEGTELKAYVQLVRPSQGLVRHLPMLAHVRFDDSTGNGSSAVGLYSRFLHGIRARSEGHAVVIVERCEDGWVVADPAAGRVIWSDQYLAECWNGEGVYLCPR